MQTAHFPNDNRVHKMFSKDNFVLLTSYILNIGVWTSNLSLIMKIILAILASATTIMAFFNQLHNLLKNYREVWIVVKIHYIITYFFPAKKKKIRRFRFRKKQQNDL